MQPKYTILFETLAGSKLYGTSTPQSDTDYRGVGVQSVHDMINPFQGFEQDMNGENEEDRTIFSLRKFFQLASDCNPNVVELVFAPEETMRVLTKDGRYLLDNASTFVSQKARQTFVGYAYGQLKRIQTHRGYLLNPPKKKPERSDYNLPEAPLFALEKIELLINVPSFTVKDEYQEMARNEKSYRDAMKNWKDYESWKNNRNPKRQVIEAKYGYDTKNALHLYRNMTEAKELLSTGKITLPRPDAKFLLEILNGHFLYEDLLLKFEELKSQVDAMHSNLPKKPDYDKLLEVYYNIVGV